MRSGSTALIAATLLTLFHPGALSALDGEVSPGQVSVTVFSGVRSDASGQTVIDTDGVVASLVDLRAAPGAAAGETWPAPAEPVARARDVGQVFGIALDDADQPNVYLTATSAFGLHLAADGTWMEGMWGPGGGPGSVWRLSAARGYAAEKFADVTLDGRANTAAALGNIAFDPWHRQLLVSDLETGMIHRLAVEDGTDLGHYDHGLDGRLNFFDVPSGMRRGLDYVAFDPASGADVDACGGATFQADPACWNIADFRRRVWGLAVRQDPASLQVRLYYAVWSRAGFGSIAYDVLPDDERRNTVWSVGLTEKGDFDIGDVRREFVVPDFGPNDGDHGSPIADIAFPRTSDSGVMVLAERGGLRNFGLAARAPFAEPHRSRLLRYAIDDEGTWQPDGRYDVGFYDRNRDGQPFIRASAAGGVDFSYDYDEGGNVDLASSGERVIAAGDLLCSRDGPCVDVATGQRTADVDVSGLALLPRQAVEEVTPAAATSPYPVTGEPYPPAGPLQSFMVPIARAGAPVGVTELGDVEAIVPYPQPEAKPEPDLSGLPPLNPGEGPVYGGIAPATAPPNAAGPAGVAPPSGGALAGSGDAGQAPQTGPFGGGGQPPPWWPQPPAQTAPSAPDQQGASFSDLALQFAAAEDTCAAGGTCDFVAVVTNTGTQPHAGKIEVAQVPPAGWVLTGSGPDWWCAVTAGSASCVVDTELAPGAQVANTMRFSVPADQVEGTVRNTAFLKHAPGSVDERGDNDSAWADVVITANATPWGVPVLPEALPMAAGQMQVDLATTGPKACAYDALCPFDVTVTNVTDQPIASTLTVVGEMARSHDSAALATAILSAGAGICSGEVSSDRTPFQCPGVFNLQPGEARTYMLAVKLDDPKLDPEVAANLNPNSSPLAVRGCVSLKVPGDTGGVLATDCDTVDVAPADTAELRPYSDHEEIPISGDMSSGVDIAATKVFAQAPIADPKAGVIEGCATDVPCRFTVTYTNVGTEDFIGVLIAADRFEWKGARYLHSSGFPYCEYHEEANGTVVSCGTLQTTLAAGDSIVWNLEFEVPGESAAWNASTASRNCAYVDWKGGGGDVNPSNDEACVSVTIPALGRDLQLTKSYQGQGGLAAPGPGAALIGGCYQGATCGFDVTITNGSAAAFDGSLTVVDEMPAGWTFAGSSSGWLCTLQIGGPLVSCTNNALKLAANASEILTITLNAPNEPGPASAQNCAHIAWGADGGDDDSGNDQDCVPVNLNTSPASITVSKTGPKSCERGGSCAYLVRVTNSGGTQYRGPVAIAERNFGSFALDGYASAHPWVCEPGNSVRCRVGDIVLDPGKSSILQIRLNLPSDLDPQIDVLRDCVRLVEPTLLPPPPEACVDTPIGRAWDLAIEKTGAGVPGSARPVTCRTRPHHSCPFNIRVSNAGATAYEGPLSFYDRTAAGGGFAYTSRGYGTRGSHPTWSCSDAGDGLIRCDHPWIKLAPGEFAPDLILGVKLPEDLSPDAEVLSNCARLVHRGGMPDARPANDGWTCDKVYLDQSRLVLEGDLCWQPFGACYNPQPAPRLDIDAIGTEKCVGPDCTFYEFTISNSGESSYARDLEVRIHLPNGARLVSGTGAKAAKACHADTWSCYQQGNDVLCQPSSCELAPGESASVHIDVKLLPPNPPPIPEGGLTKTVCGDLEWFEQTDPNDIEQGGRMKVSRACFSTLVLAAEEEKPAEVDLQVTKDVVGDCQPGTRCQFVVRVWNRGPDRFTGSVGIQDAWTPQNIRMEDDDFNACFTIRARPRSILCVTPQFDLLAGQSAPFTFWADIPATSSTGSVVNCAEIVGGGNARPPDNYTVAEIRAVQAALEARGHHVGPIDGLIGPQTRQAIREAREEMGLGHETVLDAGFVARLFGVPRAGYTGGNPANDKGCVSINVPKPPPPRQPSRPAPRVQPAQPQQVRPALPPQQQPQPFPQIFFPSPQPVPAPVPGPVPVPAPTPVPQQINPTPPGPLQTAPAQIICPLGQQWVPALNQCVGIEQQP